MILDLLIALLIALVLTWFFSVAVGTTGPWPSFWVFFVVVLLFSWALGLWVRPVGPALLGVYWLPYLVFGVFVALLIAAATPPDHGARRDRATGPERPDRAAHGAASEDVAAAGTAVAVGVFVWIALILLLVAIAIGYLW